MRRNWATYTFTTLLTPGSSSSFSSLLSTSTLITTPPSPLGTRREVSFTSRAFSPKMALNNLSSADNSFSPRGSTFPTKISFGPTEAPIITIPSSVNLASSASETLGISLVNSSVPSLVSTTSALYSKI